MKQDVIDRFWMVRAMIYARQAWYRGEIPVGAVIIQANRVVSEGGNGMIEHHDATAHAEIQAIRMAGKKTGNYRLLNTTLYVTLEPCAMCASAMVHARISRLVFAAADPKTGAAGSVFDLVRAPELNHQLQCTQGVLAEPCSELLSAFFRMRRLQIKRDKQDARHRD